MKTEHALEQLGLDFVIGLEHPLINGSMWIYPLATDPGNRALCAAAYAAAALEKIEIEHHDGHSVARLKKSQKIST